MFWHIDTDFVSLVVITLIYIYTVKLLPSDERMLKNRGFINCLRVGIVMTVVDIAASMAMEANVSRFVYHLFMCLYLITLLLTVISWFLYSLTIIFENDAKSRKLWSAIVVIPYAAYVVAVCLNPWTDMFFTLGPDMEYARSSLFLPVLLSYYTVYSVVLEALILVRRKRISGKFPVSVLILQPIILAVSIPLQLMNAGWLMILPAYGVCLVLAFLFFQNISIRGERQVSSQLRDVVEHFAVGFVICDIAPDNRIEMRYTNDVFLKICEESRESIKNAYSDSQYAGIHPADRDAVAACMHGMAVDKKGFETSFRYITQGGKVKRIYAKAQVAPGEDGAAVSYITYTDLTEQFKLQQQLSDLIQNVPCGICIYSWDGRDLKPMMTNARYTEMLGEDSMEYLSRVRGMNYEHMSPQDVERVKAESKEALLQRKTINTTYRSLNYRTGEYLWIRMRGKLLPQEDGQDLVLVSYNDVTSEHTTEEQLRQNEKDLWTKYEQERNRASLSDSALLARAIYNVNTGETTEYVYRDGTNVPESDRTAFGYISANAGLIIDDGEREAYRRLTDPVRLIESFVNGESESYLEYRRVQPNGDVRWVRCITRVLREPGTGNPLVFAYWYDIEEDKMLDIMYRGISSELYDYVTRINARTGHFSTFQKYDTAAMRMPIKGDDADKITDTVFLEGVLPEDADMARNNMLIEGMRQHLRKSDRYQFTYRKSAEGGQVLYKRITQYYIDHQREIIAVTQEDITELISAETEKNRVLADALAIANQASSAKSQFLSRVSHELRTPLNAIIGFLELAKDATSEQAAVYMANSDIAARQLLAIINDVLDMSSIESGKLKIASAPFDFKKLLQSLTTTYLAQCAKKGIAYETRILTSISETLIGDQLRVSQILLNLLGNSLKFTQAGHVWLTVRQTQGKNGMVFVRFEVSDTGCGMSEEFHTRLFKPFEQENATTAQKYGGNGLGLSIVGNLVSMMNGFIRVESTLNKGSTFIVDLPFTEGTAKLESGKVKNRENLRVLAVDDSQSEREYMAVVLSRIGVRYTCCKDAAAALGELDRADAENDPYNVCLIDWKMPNMNGLEITGRIREKYGEGVVVIIVSAYEHDRAFEKARDAGANRFIAKPLFQSSLADLLSSLSSGHTAIKDKPIGKRAFPGRRVLLAEDNVMNRMVAEGILKKLGLDCETAADGRIALDTFLAAPAGYFDAILMDIQMPNMNGFEATKAIRESGHPDGQSIQILALTANAFNEDIAKTLSSGMNAHVSKPIDPDQLVSALDAAFTESEKPRGE